MKKQSEKSKGKKALRIIIIIVAFLLVSNAIATKPIYDMIFGRSDKESYDFNKEDFKEITESRETINIAEGNETIRAYFYDVPEEKGLILIAPGLNSGADMYIPMSAYFNDEGYDVFAFDPYGCDGSTGKSQKGFSQESVDLDACLDYVSEHYPEEDIYLFGHSRGGYSVCCADAEGRNIKAVCSVSGLNSAMEAVMGLSSTYVGKVAYANYLNLMLYQMMLFGKNLTLQRADKIIESEDIPVLIVQGAEDKRSPADKYSIYSHKDAIGRSGAEFVLKTEEGKCGHTDIMFDENGKYGLNEELMQEVLSFYGVD